MGLWFVDAKLHSGVLGMDAKTTLLAASLVGLSSNEYDFANAFARH